MTKFQEKIYNEIPKPTNYRVVKFSPLQGYLYNQFLIIVDYPVENLSTRAILSYGNGAVEEAIFLLNSPKLIIEWSPEENHFYDINDNCSHLDPTCIYNPDYWAEIKLPQVALLSDLEAKAK